MTGAKHETFGKVAVLMGGISAEREISLRSGAAVLEALRRQGVDAYAVDWKDDLYQALAGHGFDRVFVILHGRGGEDGCAQGALEVMGLPYTGSGVLGSALAMDKARSKRIWMSHGLPTPPFKALYAGFKAESVLSELGLPLMVKPACEGSSIGATKVEQADQLPAAWSLAAKYDECVLAEAWIHGSEYTVTILDGKPYPLIKLETPRSFYDYKAKYEDDRTRYLCPCGLPEKNEQSLQQLALKAFDSLGASGWGRVDLILDEKSDPWLIEVNTVPGMTSHSLVPKSVKAAGMDFDELVIRILATSHGPRLNPC